jgi:phenylacetic acid degradation operon negative regulatory protein
MQAGGSPQHLLLTLLGDYWYGQRAALPSAALVALLGRVRHHRGERAGGAVAVGPPGPAGAVQVGPAYLLLLSARAADVLREGVRHILSFGDRDEPWSGQWTVAAFSVPEDHRDLRHNLRTRLGWLGFAPLYDGVWVCPHERAAEVGQVIAELGIGTATVFRAEIVGDLPAGGNPIRAWNLDALRDMYLHLQEEYEPVRERLRSGQVGTAEALIARTAFMDAWRNFPNLDPELPAKLLPPQWPRAEARALFIELYDGLAWLAEKRVVQVVTEFDEELAHLVRSHTTEFAG